VTALAMALATTLATDLAMDLELHQKHKIQSNTVIKYESKGSN